MNEPSGRTPLRTELRWLLVSAFWMAVPAVIGCLWFLSQLRKL
jgi:hypothetical protein